MHELIDGFFKWPATSITAFFAGVAGLYVLFTGAAKAYAIMAAANQKRRQAEMDFQREQEVLRFKQNREEIEWQQKQDDRQAEIEALCEEQAEHGHKYLLRKQDKRITDLETEAKQLRSDVEECRVARASMAERINHLTDRVRHCEEHHDNE